MVRLFANFPLAVLSSLVGIAIRNYAKRRRGRKAVLCSVENGKSDKNIVVNFNCHREVLK